MTFDECYEQVILPAFDCLTVEYGQMEYEVKVFPRGDQYIFSVSGSIKNQPFMFQIIILDTHAEDGWLLVYREASYTSIGQLGRVVSYKNIRACAAEDLPRDFIESIAHKMYEALLRKSEDRELAHYFKV